MFGRFAFWFGGVATLAALSIVLAVPRNTLEEISYAKQTKHTMQRLADEEVSNNNKIKEFDR